MLAVVPLLGTWIEIERKQDYGFGRAVVPLLGTWIEIFQQFRG